MSKLIFLHIRRTHKSNVLKFLWVGCDFMFTCVVHLWHVLKISLIFLGICFRVHIVTLNNSCL
uniref:Uncharacterized protein n=1 Tax=Glycine max TaxID=3847 RepID=K7KIC2_SOYBN